MTDDPIDPGQNGATGDDAKTLCAAMTENGTRCQNPAFADGYCWMHGGTGQKSGDMTDAPFPTDISPDSSAPDDLVELPSSLPEIDGSSEMELPPPLPEIDTPPETELPPPLKETDASPEAELPPPLPEVDVPPEAELPPPLPEIDVPPEAELPPPLPEIDASPETELPPPLPEIDASPEQEVFDTDIEPVFSQESENTDPGSSAEPSAPENGMESIEEETPLMLDPSDFEFKPDPESAAEDVELPSDSDSSGMPTVPEKEDATGLPDIDDGLIELDLTGLDLEVQEPPVEPSNEIEAVSESTFDDTPEGDGSDASEPLPEGDIQMPESFRLEMASEKEKALPEPEDSPEEPEHDLDQVEMDETLELEMDFSDKDLGLSSEEPIKDDVPADTPDRMPEEETPDDDLEMIPASPGHEPPREVRESDVLLPGMEPDTAPPVEDTAPDAKVSEGESEKVVAPPPQFDLFEELPGEDWMEIEVNIEEGGYSTSDLDEFAPNLLLDKEAPETSKSESNGANLVDSGPDATDATGSGEQGIDGNDVPRSADMAAESQVRTSTGQVEPSYYVPAAEEPKGLLSRRVSLPLPFFVGLLILIAGITYGLATPLRPADGPVDAGDTAIRLVDIESQFVQNQGAGNLLVITGRAINDYDHPRNFIRVTGKVYTNDRFVQSLSVFCGNTLSDEELPTLSTADIVTQLLRRADRDKSNMNIATGSAVPLMIVFPITADMIDRLDSYTVEVIESKPS